MDERPIGVLDSGVGGISVLQTARRLLPSENYVYYGDNLNAPYGPKPLDEIRALTKAGVDVLLKQNIKALLIACNTATSAYAQTLREALLLPVIAMEPALKPAHALRRGGQVIVLATRATLSLEKFQKLMELYGEGAVPVAGDGLVELVENGNGGGEAAERRIKELFAPYEAQPIDAIVLGCTHYLFLKKAMQNCFPGVPLVDGNEGTVRQLERVLAQNGLLRDGLEGKTTLLSSGGEHFIALMNTLLKRDIP